MAPVSPTTVDEALVAARVVDETLVDWDGLARVMSPLEPCDEQPATTVNALKQIVSTNRLTLGFPFIYQRQYKGQKAPA